MTLKYKILTLLIFTFVKCFSQDSAKKKLELIDKLNNESFERRLINPNSGVELGKHARKLSKEINYNKGTSEANRVIGINYSYLNKRDSALVLFLEALTISKANKDFEAQSKIYNNIGNLYREIDKELGLAYYRKSLEAAKLSKSENLIASTSFNIGIIYFRDKQYKKALSQYNLSLSTFKKFNNEIGIINSLQNIGVAYSALNEPDTAKKLLLLAKSKAVKNGYNKSVASINITLIDIYIAKQQFLLAEKAIKEGFSLIKELKSKSLEHDYQLLSYQLENKRKNFEKALEHLHKVYRDDSIAFSNVESEKIQLLETQHKFIEREKQNQLIIEKQKTNKVIFFASIAISALALILIFILYKNNIHTHKNNRMLKTLNEEVSLQKDELNKVNQNLEQIISERTADLQVKNRKLSEYSSHLSHQIRGPIATMKGLMLLEKDELIDLTEYKEEMEKCVNEIDSRIININEVLHDLSAPGLIPRPVDKETES